MAQLSSPARTAVAVLLFAVVGMLLPTHALAGGDQAGHTSTAMHDGATLAKATAITPFRVAVHKMPAPAGHLPAAIVLGAVLGVVAAGTVAVRGRHRPRLASPPSRGPPPLPA